MTIRVTAPPVSDVSAGIGVLPATDDGAAVDPGVGVGIAVDTGEDEGPDSRLRLGLEEIGVFEQAASRASTMPSAAPFPSLIVVMSLRWRTYPREQSATDRCFHIVPV
ncbi:MAG: hypothetical protein M3067_00520 [Chloroflexota bacterium]|nr:hypothetical protein [Chloroflexota bacterium]